MPSVSAGALAGLLFSVSALASGPVEDAEEGGNPRIYGGTAVQTCAWPSAVYLSMGGGACTATLVHPQIAMTAGHCPNSTSGTSCQIRFGENPNSPTATVQATCYSNPSYTGQVGPTDYGYCKLSQPVTNIQIAPVAYGCELDYLTAGREVAIVGYGQSDNGGSGTKREAMTFLNSIGDQAMIGGNGIGACFGDSGGPAYVKLDEAEGGDGTWRAFGIVSGGSNCGQAVLYSLMHVAVPWVEEHSGIDITPCYNVNGDWEPTPDCGGHPTNYENGNGSWGGAIACEGPEIAMSGICGPAFGSENDDDPPTVTITSPPSGSRFDTDGADTVAVTVTADADDGEGYGVLEVRLTVDGQEFPNNADSSEPWEWTLQMPPGGYMIGAIAVDYASHEGLAEEIAIGIDQDAPGSGDGSGDGSDGSGDDGSGTDDGDDGDTGDGGYPPGYPGGSGDDDKQGCGCSARQPVTGPLISGLVLLGLVARRRRTHLG